MKDEPKVTQPNFTGWAITLDQFRLMKPEKFIQELEDNLKAAFNQGESYGVFKGYNAGYTRGHNEGFVKGQDAGQILRNLTDIVEGK